MQSLSWVVGLELGTIAKKNVHNCKQNWANCKKKWSKLQKRLGKIPIKNGHNCKINWSYWKKHTIEEKKLDTIAKKLVNFAILHPHKK